MIENSFRRHSHHISAATEVATAAAIRHLTSPRESTARTGRRGLDSLRLRRLCACSCAWLAVMSHLTAADFQAGVARVKITPPTPFWLSGYAARTNPAPVVLQDLWAKALAVRDPQGHQAVLVTMDSIGLSHEVSQAVADQAYQQFRLRQSDLFLSFSHTHSGPVIGSNLGVMFNFDAAEAERVRQYTSDLTERLVRVTGEALQSLSPAQLAVGQGSAGFAVNRRAPTTNGFQIGVNTNGPMDHAVPVLRVTAPDGQLRAVLFGYGCHNTTLGGDFYQINGDYAGQAQATLEEAHPGATALFMMLCGADQNPNPRGKVELARQHGQALAAEVDRVLAAPLRIVRPPIRTARETIQLDLAPHTRQTFLAETNSPDKFRQRRARLMLAAYDRHEPIRKLAYPVQALRFNQDLTLLALAGEVVVDYALRAKRDYTGENLVVAGYCNEVGSYIPSLRVQREGGYEPVISMIYYGLPGPFTENIEEDVFQCIYRTLKRVGARPGQ